ncbi:MAG: YfhO family protein [Ruminococcus sp.]|jgi:uncharacterized membrane protein YfhO
MKKVWIPGKYRVILAAFIFPVLICCVGFALTGVYPFGSRSALIIDGVHQYLGFYEEFSRQLGKGMGWTFSGYGLGHNFYSVFSYYLSSPFSLLVLLLMRIMYVNEAVTLVVLLKIGLSGACMAWYMQKKTKGRKDIAVCTGCMYALSNYMLGYYSNLMWLDCLMLLPLLAWSIEDMVSSGRWRKYTLVLGYGIISNYYMGFILCVFSLLYYTAIYAGAEKRRDPLWKSAAKFAGASLLSGGASAVILIPAIFAVSETTAARRAAFSLTAETYGSLWEQLSRLLFHAFPYATSADQASLNIYCGCAALLFLILYFFKAEISWRKKAAAAGLLIFYFAGFHFAALNLLLHGLHEPVGMPNRFAFVFVFLLLKTAGEGWEKTVSADRKTGKRILCFLILAEIGIHGVLSICNNGSANRNLYEDSGREIQRMMRAKEDASEYRTVIVNPILRNEELLFGLKGVSLFSSTNTDQMQRWMERMGFETGKNRFQYAGGTEIMDMLLGIRYLACRNDMKFDMPYQKTDEGEYFTLFENPRALESGYLVDLRMKDFRLQGNNPLETQNYLLEQMGCGALFQTQMVFPAEQESDAADKIYEIYLKGKEHGYLCLNGMEPSSVEIDGRIQKSSSWNNNFLDLGYSDKGRIVQVSVSEYGGTAILGTAEDRRIDAVYQKLRQNQIRLQKGKGTIQAEKDGILFFPVFYDKGLSARIDGKETEVLNLDGMTGIPVVKGNHELEFFYEVPGLKAGAACSAASLAVLGISFWLGKAKKKYLRGGTNEENQYCGPMSE